MSDARHDDVLAVLVEAIAANGLQAEPMEDFPSVLTGEAGDADASWQFFCGVEDEFGVLVYAVYPDSVPQERCNAVAELIARANYVIRYGSLELDFDDGEVRARTSARGGPQPLEFHVVAELVRNNLILASLTFPLVRSVALDQSEPADCIAAFFTSDENEAPS
jgi:hypothetical protein